MNLETLEEFIDLDPQKRNLEIYLRNPQIIEKHKMTLQKIFPNEFIFAWSDMNKSLFSALKVERNVMFIILSLIIIIESSFLI